VRLRFGREDVANAHARFMAAFFRRVRASLITADIIAAASGREINPKPLGAQPDVLTYCAVRKYTEGMPGTTHRKRSSPPEKRVSRTYRLPLSKVRAAKRALGAATATETIERALDLVVFQRELVDGTRSLHGVQITRPDPER
jgi:hypothetical protein